MDFTPLRRHRDYRLLYMAQSVSFLGTMMTYVALPYQMFQLTHSSLQVGLLGLAELIPLLLTAFIGGALADSLDRKRLVIVTDVFLSCGSLALALLAWHGSPPVWSLYVLAGFMSAMSGLQRPSIDAMMPRLVPREDLMAAAALGSFRGSLIMIVGPALGGVLIASMGLAFAYADRCRELPSGSGLHRHDPDDERPREKRASDAREYPRGLSLCAQPAGTWSARTSWISWP
jgi:MFS family permease